MSRSDPPRPPVWKSLHPVTKVLVLATAVQWILVLVDLAPSFVQVALSLAGAGDEDGAHLTTGYVAEVIRRLVWPLFNLGAIATVEFLARILAELKSRSDG